MCLKTIGKLYFNIYLESQLDNAEESMSRGTFKGVLKTQLSLFTRDKPVRAQRS